jgi:hypothetical protein
VSHPALDQLASLSLCLEGLRFCCIPPISISSISRVSLPAQLLGNHGVLKQREKRPNDANSRMTAFATSARDCKIAQHGDDIEAVVAPVAAA